MNRHDARLVALAITAAAYVALIPLGWPGLSLNMQPADLLFPLLAASALFAGWTWRAHPVDWALAAYLVGLAASIPASLSPHESLIAFGKACYLAAVYAVLVQTTTRLGAQPLSRWFVWSTAAISAVALASAAVFVMSGRSWSVLGEAMPLPYVGTVFRLKGTAHSPELFGNVLTFAGPLALWLAANRTTARFARVCAGAIIVAAVLTFSKAIGGLAAAVAIVMWSSSHRRPAQRWTIVALAAVLVACFNLTAVVALRGVESEFGKNPRVQPPVYQYGQQSDRAGADMFELRISYNPMSYYLLKRAEWQAFRLAPWTGIGLGTFHLEAERAFQEGRLPEAYRRADAHSTPLGRLAETGIVGAATLAALVFVIWRTGLSAAAGSDVHAGLAWAVFAAIVGLLINSINVDILNFRFFWFGVGVLRALDRSTIRAS